MLLAFNKIIQTKNVYSFHSELFFRNRHLMIKSIIKKKSDLKET